MAHSCIFKRFQRIMKESVDILIKIIYSKTGLVKRITKY